MNFSFIQLNTIEVKLNFIETSKKANCATFLYRCANATLLAQIAIVGVILETHFVLYLQWFYQFSAIGTSRHLYCVKDMEIYIIAKQFNKTILWQKF